MNTGALRYTVELQKPKQDVASNLDPDINYQAYKRRCSVRFAGAKGTLVANNYYEEYDVEFKFRYDGVTNSVHTDWRILFENDLYTPTSPAKDMYGNRREILILARRVSNA